MSRAEFPPYQHDEDLIERTRAEREACVRAYPFAGTAVVLGRGSKPEIELHLEHCRTDGVPLFRRRGGGCSVVLDPGNVIVSVTLPIAGLGSVDRHFARLSTWMIAGLEAVGVKGVGREGVSDLAIGDRKIGGSCLYLARDVLFYSTTLLVDPEVALMARYLQHPPREPGYRRGRVHADFVAGLAALRGVPPAVDFAAALTSRLTAPAS